MDDGETILRHTVAPHGGRSSRVREKGILGVARHLARDIGPRPPGSKGERKAARFVERELTSLGYRVECHSFRIPSTTAWSEVLSHLVTLAGVLLFPGQKSLSYALVTLGFLFFLLEGFGRSPFAWLSGTKRSENVVARTGPAGGAELSVVLVAHLDSPLSASHKQRLRSPVVRMGYLADFAFQAAIFILFTLAFGGWLLKMEPSRLDFLWRVGLALAVPVLLSLLFLFVRAAAGSHTPGANHNASGVAVLLELARFYSRHPLHSAELWFVFTGASEVGARGMRAFLRHYHRRRKDDYYLVIDGVGRGFPTFYHREGRLLAFRANRRLCRLAAEVSRSYPNLSSGYARNRWYNSEGFHLLSRGRQAITISASEGRGTPRYFRQHKDDYLNLDARSLRLALDYLRTLIDKLDHGGLSGKRRRRASGSMAMTPAGGGRRAVPRSEKPETQAMSRTSGVEAGRDLGLSRRKYQSAEVEPEPAFSTSEEKADEREDLAGPVPRSEEQERGPAAAPEP